eukprot:CAMPEP_0204829190 /NCGR_PEP_ID=MMETSP1346-20131115/7244_1 /ASSEMBLY_ACC=CAM_ASM_000771 /TAXON_ID=215587 /ORGANISM="Aplanochytrium stocchinoi, Strain GSBS06" /LENGTH=188 /DNA_ID=CAMNT_0051958771 /DNA_START=207 /DNA_END=770 /DNA_ORIENTATION=-
MGGKPCKPIISYEAAEEALCKDSWSKGQVSKQDLRKLFENASKLEASCVSSAPSDVQKLSKAAFKEKFQFAGPFFDLGDKVVERLFKVLGADDAEGTLDYESFVCSVYMFTKSTELEKQRLIFNMFDFNGSGFIKKKEFRDMTIAIIRGDNTPPEFELEFKTLSKLMTDSAMALYDTNRDGKLSFEEW